MCAASLAVLDEIEEKDLLRNAKEMGERFAQKLRALNSPLVREVRALGLMIGMEVVGDFNARIGVSDDGRMASIVLTERLMHAGLLVVPAGASTIRFLPPLNISGANLDAAVEILASVLMSPEIKLA